MLVLGDRAYDSIHSMGCLWSIVKGCIRTGGIWENSVWISRLGIYQVKLFGLQDGLFFGLGTFGGNVLGDGL